VTLHSTIVLIVNKIRGKKDEDEEEKDEGEDDEEDEEKQSKKKPKKKPKSSVTPKGESIPLLDASSY